MWQKEVTSYRDESYYLFNDAIENYREHLQQIFNRGMIEAWITSGDVSEKSPWPAEKTISYFEKLPYPDNDTERKIWLAGFNSTQTVETLETRPQDSFVKSPSKKLVDLVV